ncbi:hypothetical protein QBC44DRAFT_319560 [Cladorrhinum sp. PSN332]|nr:hypothetical protein QBC44DRAFT_319560 [Cladorrhinum sp. PSN332]
MKNNFSCLHLSFSSTYPVKSKLNTKYIIMGSKADTPAPAPALVSEHLFSATVNLAACPGPIPLLEGGHRLVEPITGGTIKGPGFNGTLEGGLAAPILVRDHTEEGDKKAFVTFCWAYGKADDGSPFFLEKIGVGIPEIQNTRIQLQVGGKYKHLQKTYIIARPAVCNEERTQVAVECYSVPLLL